MVLENDSETCVSSCAVDQRASRIMDNFLRSCTQTYGLVLLMYSNEIGEVVKTQKTKLSLEVCISSLYVTN